MATRAANDAKTRTPTIKVAGKALADELEKQLISMRVERAIDTPSSVSLRFFDQFFELFDAVTFNVGDDLEVLIPASDSAVTTVFLGKITELGIEQEDEDASQRLIVEAHDVSHQLARASDFTAYLDHSISDIVKEIASRHGLTPKVDATTAKSYRLQASTDLHFLNQLAADAGYEWFVHGDELHFRERPTEGGPELSLSDGSLTRFSARYNGTRVPKKVTVTGWDPATQQGVTGTWDGSTAPGASVLRSNSDLATTQYGNAVSTFGKELLVPTEGVDDQSSATTRAELIGRRLAGAGLQVSGIARCDPAIQAGHLLTLKGLGDKLSGDYYVTRVVHEFGESQELRTRFVSEPAPDLGSDAVRTGGPYDGWTGRGLVIAYVTSIKDPEKLGRVKVAYPSLKDQNESEWARVITPGAGQQRGLDFRPEVGDEVVVAFERGHLSKPLVLGGLWSEKFKPPFDDVVGASGDGVVSKRVITSRVGHSISISDGDNPPERHVDIRLADEKTFVHVGEDKVRVETPKGKPIELISGSSSVTITDGGDLKIEAASLDLKVKGSVKIEGQDIALKGSTGVKIDGGSAFEAKGGTAKIQGQSMAEVKGQMVKIN